MSCPDCETAKTQLWRGYQADCKGCQARQLAEEPAFYNADKAGALTPEYKTAIKALFGDAWKEAHAEVRKWAEIRKSLG